VANAKDLERFSESGRGIPVTLSRPQGALPCSPLVRQAYVHSPRVRLGWGQGVIPVGEVMLEATQPLSRHDPVSAAAKQMLRDELGFVPVCDGPRFIGVVFEDAILQVLADGQLPQEVGQILSLQVPTCTEETTLDDAVRLMLACHLRSIPVIGKNGDLLGLLMLAEAAAQAVRDPAVGELIERVCCSPSWWARHAR
jgi:CBS domain-containing protein